MKLTLTRITGTHEFVLRKHVISASPFGNPIIDGIDHLGRYWRIEFSRKDLRAVADMEKLFPRLPDKV